MPHSKLASIKDPTAKKHELFVGHKREQRVAGPWQAGGVWEEAREGCDSGCPALQAKCIESGRDGDQSLPVKQRSETGMISTEMGEGKALACVIAAAVTQKPRGTTA